MNCGLFESLTGYFLDGTPAENLNGTEALIRSICDNLNRILNTRSQISQQNKTSALVDVYHNLPSNAPQVEEIISRLIKHFEPRLQNVSVRFIPSERVFNHSGFLISGENPNTGELRFLTTFKASGNVITDLSREKNHD